MAHQHHGGDDHHHHQQHDPFTTSTNYPHSLRTRGGTSPYAPNRATTLSNPSPSLQRRPPLPEVPLTLLPTARD